jgi:hypothetical protein
VPPRREARPAAAVDAGADTGTGLGGPEAKDSPGAAGVAATGRRPGRRRAAVGGAEPTAGVPSAFATPDRDVVARLLRGLRRGALAPDAG